MLTTIAVYITLVGLASFALGSLLQGWSDHRVIAVAALPGPILVASFGVLMLVLNLIPPTHPDALTDENGVPHHTDAWGLILLPLSLVVAAVMTIVGGATAWAVVKILNRKPR